MKRIYFVVVFFLGISMKINAQTNIISDTSVVYPQIKAFLIRGLKDTAGIKIALIKQLNLLDSTNNNFGVFTFLEFSSEARNYLYLRNYGATKITVIPKYHIDSVMKSLSVYFNDNKAYITYPQRLGCTKKVIEILEGRDYISPYSNNVVRPTKEEKQKQ